MSGRRPVMLTDAERGLIVILTKYAIADRTETFERAGAALGAGYPTTQRIKESWAAGLDELRQLAEHVKADPEPWLTVDEHGQVMRLVSAHPLHNHSCRTTGVCDLFRAVKENHG